MDVKDYFYPGDGGVMWFTSLAGKWKLCLSGQGLGLKLGGVSN